MKNHLHKIKLRVLIWGVTTANIRNRQKMNLQILFYVIGGCRDHRLFHVELRETVVTPQNTILTEFSCVTDYTNHSEIVSWDFFTQAISW